MKNIFKIFSSENLKKNLKTVWERFPVSLAIILIVAGLFFTEMHYHNDISEFYNKRIFIAILALIMTFIFSIATYLSTENSSKNKLQRNLFQLLPLGFGIIFYNIFSLDPNDFENFLFFFLSFAGIISFLYFAPYFKNVFKKGISQSIFYTYFYNISVVILISFIFAGLLFGLGAIAIAATDALFDLNITSRLTYGNWTILSLSIIAPIFALTQIPVKKSFLENHFNENAFFSFLIKFVAIPFIYLYFFILYAYTIKVLSNFSEWPKGEVSWLVIGFSIFGYLAYSFSYIFEEKNKVIKSFRKVFPYAVIPQVFMLFYAIYLRINQYDITVNRYFVVVFGLWLLLISLHFIFSKKKNLIVIPVSLSLIIILISIIPRYNVYSFPEIRQLDRLETNLKKAGIIETTEEMYKYTIAQKIVPLKNYSDISQDLSKNIYSGIDYLCDFNSCESVKNLFPNIYSEILEKDKDNWEKNQEKQIKELEKKKKYNGLSKWEIVRGITEKIKVKNYFNKNDDNRKYFEFSKEYKQDFFPMNIAGYSKIYRIMNYDKWNKQENYAEFDSLTSEIIIKENGKINNKINISEISKKLIKKFGKQDSRELTNQDLSFEIEGGKYKLFFESISVKNPDYKEKDSDKKINSFYFSNYSNGYILVK